MRTFGWPRTKVAEASFLPSVGAVGPALTVMANAIRVGEHLAHRLR